MKINRSKSKVNALREKARKKLEKLNKDEAKQILESLEKYCEIILKTML